MRALQPEERIAVAIPTRDRPQYLAALLASLVHQSYRHWMLILNDGGETPVESVDVIQDLLAGIRARGHEVRILREGEGWERHQRSMLAAPPDIEFLVRVDDDVMLRPEYLERLLEPFRLLSHLRVAAVGGTASEPHLPPRDLDACLMRPDWQPTIERPTWRLQGHEYWQDEVLEVESLLGHSLAYRRSAAQEVGGWAVPGYSNQAHCEESDMCSRWRARQYKLLVTTQARCWHLYAPGGGSRRVRKDITGVHLVSDPAFVNRDGALFEKRRQDLQLVAHPLRRYRLEELRAGQVRERPMHSLPGWIKQLWLRIRGRLRRWFP